MVKNNFFKRNTNYISRFFEQKMHILDPIGGRLFVLNRTASIVWSYLWKPRTIEEINQKIVKSFNVSEKTSKRDVLSFLNASLKNKLILKIEK